MMMNDFFPLVSAVATGLLLGAQFFGGLWWTIRAGLRSRRPALWFIGSMVLRMSIALGGFYYVGHEHWQRLAACLLGFITARLLAKALVRPSTASSTRGEQAATHAP